MNPGFFHQQSNSSNQFGGTSGQFPRLSAPNFSGFSASPGKPFLPMFGVPVVSVSTNGDLGMSSRKRRSQNITNDMDLDARQRKVFISEERMVRGMSRLNLDQGPDILQDLATPEDELLNEDDGDKILDEDGILKSEMVEEIDLEENDEMSSAKVVLSDTLKQFVDRKQPILPTRVMERISQQQPPNMSRELVLWEPPGQQIRNAIRKALSNRRNAEEDEVVVMASQSNQSRTCGALPDLLLLPTDDPLPRPEQLTSYVISTDPNLTFEQMET